MGFFDTIYIITEEKLDSNLVRQQWFWDKDEAEQFYQNQLDIEDRIITLYAFDLRDSIEEKVSSLMANRHSSLTPTPLQEIRSSRKVAEPEAEWSELEFRADGTFYIERLKSPDYWPYRVERYNKDQWRVFDATTMTPIAIISPRTVGSNETFRVVVNGYSQDKTFSNLKGAIIYAAEEYNGV